jgi:hypothetical protein
VPLIWLARQAVNRVQGPGYTPIGHRLPLPLIGTWVHVAAGPLGWMQTAAASLAGVLPAIIMVALVLLRLRRTALAWLALVMVLTVIRLVSHGNSLAGPIIALQFVALAALLTTGRLPRLAAISARSWLLTGVIVVTAGALAVLLILLALAAVRRSRPRAPAAGGTA